MAIDYLKNPPGGKFIPMDDRNHPNNMYQIDTLPLRSPPSALRVDAAEQLHCYGVHSQQDALNVIKHLERQLHKEQDAVASMNRLAQYMPPDAPSCFPIPRLTLKKKLLLL